MDRIYVTKGWFDIIFSQCLPADVLLPNSEAQDRSPTLLGAVLLAESADGIFARARRLLGAEHM